MTNCLKVSGNMKCCLKVSYTDMYPSWKSDSLRANYVQLAVVTWKPLPCNQFCSVLNLNLQHKQPQPPKKKKKKIKSKKICTIFVIIFFFFLYAGDCFHSSCVYVCLHVLLLVQIWNVDILLIYTKTNKFSQLADDMLVGVFPLFSQPSTEKTNLRMYIISLQIFTRQVARYAAPISYNFLNLIRLPRDAKDSKTIFEKVSLLLHCLLNSAFLNVLL